MSIFDPEKMNVKMKLTNSSFTIFTIYLNKQKIDPARGEKRRPDIQKRVKKGDKKNVQQERKCRNLRCYVVNFPWFSTHSRKLKGDASMSPNPC